MNRKAKKVIAMAILLIITFIALTSINSYILMIERIEEVKQLSVAYCEIWFIGKVSIETGMNFLRGTQVAILVIACIAIILIDDWEIS